MHENDGTAFAGDRSIVDPSEDKLGFGPIALRIASAVNGIASGQSLILGLEGVWGSGKSSLLKLAENELSKISNAPPPQIVRFEPWLIGNRDGLLAYLFGELLKKIAEVEQSKGFGVRGKKEAAKKAGEALKKFARGIGQLGGAVEVFGEATGFSPIKLIGKGLSSLRNFSKESAINLVRLKSELIDALVELDVKFLVTIDDVDRLDPSEVLEVLRLAKSVADLPNVSYLLCFDSDVLARSVEQAARVENGDLYLEKIIQLKIAVPEPEPFALRNWFADEVARLLIIGEDDRERLRAVIDFEGGRQLKTPRSVKRTLDSIRFASLALDGIEFDKPDLVWLALIKEGNPKLYRWIETYCGTQSAVTLGTATVSGSEVEAELKHLFGSVSDGHFDDMTYRHQFASVLPGVALDFDTKSKGLKIFQGVEDGDRDRAIRTRRLASIDHYRLYFAFDAPSHSLTGEELEKFLEVTRNSVVNTSDLMMSWHSVQSANGLTKCELALERISSFYLNDMTSSQTIILFRALADCMDRLYFVKPITGFEYNSIWDRAERLVKRVLEKVEAHERRDLICNIFGEGEALGWLTSLLRRETFAHGRYGNQSKLDSEWYLSDDELDEVSILMCWRYHGLSFSDFASTPRPISLLFAWRQMGDPDGPSQLMSRNSVTDEGLVQSLEALTNIQRHNGSEVIALSRENVSPFLDYNAALSRLVGLSEQGSSISPRADALLKASDNSF